MYYKYSKVGSKRWYSGSIPPRTVWKPQPHWLVADWLGFVKPPALGEHTIPSSETNAFFISTTPINRGRKRLFPRKIPPRTTRKAQLGVHHCWLRFVKPDDSSSHDAETPTTGTPLLARVREAGGLLPLGERRFNRFICHDVIDLLLIVK